MSEVQAAHPPAASARAPARPGVGFAIAGALACGIALTWTHALDIWTTGAFYDTDDAMRMVQARDLMAGQSWYDMTAHRMDPPAGVFMHWSRVVDVPLVLLVKLFGLFAGPPQAEALARLVFPLALLAGLYAAVAWVAGQIGDRAQQIAAIALTFAMGPVFGQFVPGRIDHHAPQIVLLTLAAGAAMAALDPARSRFAALAGVCIALSLSISLENLPFFFILVATPVVAWVLRGDEQTGALRHFALALAGGLAALFLATVGPQRWFVAACDAYSLVHLSAGLAGAAALLALAGLTKRLPGLGARLAAAGVLGLAPLMVARLVAPSCLGDPFVGLDPLVRSVWLSNVGEIQGLAALARSQPSAAIMVAAPLALAFFATCLAAALHRDIARSRLALLAALIAVGFVMTFWGVRVFASVAPLAAIGGGLTAIASARKLARAGAFRTTLSVLFCLPFGAVSYALALPQDSATSEMDSRVCLRPSAMKPLDALPPGLVLAPIDAGAHLLAFTRHSVLAAPYHRDNPGNRLSLDVFMASPDKARAFAQASGADYLVFCGALKQAHIMAERAPNGLAAALLAGRAPDWLEPLDVKAAPEQAFRIRKTPTR